VATDLNGIRIFIATPGGLEDERKRFREAIEEINRIDAFERGIAFIPIGWELTSPGLGRPQEQINDEVRKCDYLVLVLHDRWGTPPSSNGKFTSGTEEEYNVARECAADRDMPMRNIAVMFKGVDAARMADPGEQLKQVLSFRQRLEEERGLLFKTFDTASEFENHLRAMLLKWAREEEGGSPAKTDAVPPPNEPPGDTGKPAGDAGLDGETVLEAAGRLADEGRLTQAESLYATAVVARTDVEAMTKYVRFLRRTGRLDMAEAVSNRLFEVGEDRNDAGAMVEALSNRAIVHRKRGNYAHATSDLERAVKIAQDGGPEQRANLAFLLDNLGLTLRKQGRLHEALDRHLEALDLKRDIDDPKSRATTLNHAAALLGQQGRVEEAVEMTREALGVFDEAEYPRGQAQAHANLGELLAQGGDTAGAKEQFAASLELNEKLNSPEGIGMNLWQLARLAVDEGDLDEAEKLVRTAIRRAGTGGLDRPESIGAPLQLLGRIELLKGDPGSAMENLRTAALIFDRNEQPLGAAWSYADLAAAAAAAGDHGRARSALAQAERLGSGLTHRRFQEVLETSRREVSDLGPDESEAA
jgi:tetratricopeptide (TPR) repeat protein